MNKTINQYINQLHLDPKREAAVRKLIQSVSQSSGSSNGGSSGGSLKYLPKSYSIDWSVADEGWKSALKGGLVPPTEIAATVKSGGIITSSDTSAPEYLEAFSFLPVGFQNRSTFDVILFETLESVIDFFKTYYSIPISMNGIKEISEEEYYSFDNNNVPEA